MLGQDRVQSHVRQCASRDAIQMLSNFELHLAVFLVFTFGSLAQTLAAEPPWQCHAWCGKLVVFHEPCPALSSALLLRVDVTADLTTGTMPRTSTTGVSTSARAPPAQSPSLVRTAIPPQHSTPAADHRLHRDDTRTCLFLTFMMQSILRQEAGSSIPLPEELRPVLELNYQKGAQPFVLFQPLHVVLLADTCPLQSLLCSLFTSAWHTAQVSMRKGTSNPSLRRRFPPASLPTDCHSTRARSRRIS